MKSLTTSFFCVVIIVIKCIAVSAYLTFRLYCRWFGLGKFLAFWTGVSQTTVFRVRELTLFSLKLEATYSSETWDKPGDFCFRLHEVWILCWLENATQCIRTYVPAYLVVPSCRPGTFKSAVTKDNCARDTKLVLQ